VHLQSIVYVRFKGTIWVTFFLPKLNDYSITLCQLDMDWIVRYTCSKGKVKIASSPIFVSLCSEWAFLCVQKKRRLPILLLYWCHFNRTTPVRATRKYHNQRDTTYFFWNMAYGSISMSVMSIFLPFSMTSGCLRTINHPMCEKKNPRDALCGSATVSLYLWCCRWSLIQTYKQFWGTTTENV